MVPSRKPVALVTGANKGIGFEVARAIANSGYAVLFGARNPTTGREGADALTSERLDVRFIELDVTRMETISAAAARIETDCGKLDVPTHVASDWTSAEKWETTAGTPSSSIDKSAVSVDIMALPSRHPVLVKSLGFRRRSAATV